MKYPEVFATITSSMVFGLIGGAALNEAQQMNAYHEEMAAQECLTAFRGPESEVITQTQLDCINQAWLPGSSRQQLLARTGESTIYIDDFVGAKRYDATHLNFSTFIESGAAGMLIGGFVGSFFIRGSSSKDVERKYIPKHRT